MKSSDLIVPKPCPFCGGKAVIGKAYPSARNVSCTKCEAAIAWNFKNDIKGNEGEIYAAKQWNKRAGK